MTEGDYKPPCEVDRFKAREIDPESLESYEMRNLARAFHCEMDARREAEAKVQRMAPYMPAPAAGESRTDWLDLANERIEELEEAIRVAMAGQCPGCRAGQPYDGHCHTETGDLFAMNCTAYPALRKALNRKEGS